MKKLALHNKIIIGLIGGVLWGLFAINMGLADFTSDWIQPIGQIFINALKMIAVPLVFVSLVSGISSLNDVSKLSSLGSKTVGLYLATTVIAVTIGLTAVNVFQPGNSFSPELTEQLKTKFADKVDAKTQDAKAVEAAGPLQFLVDMVPTNVFDATTDNRNMLQVIVFTVLFGVGLVMVPGPKTQAVRDFFDAANLVILKIVDIIMSIAPYAVFGLLAGLIVEIAGDDPAQAGNLLLGLGKYSLVVIFSLGLMIFVVYPSILKLFTNIRYKAFFRGIMPAQMLAFSTSSSAATLPVTMERVERHLGVPEETASFVLPLGATINMDGTSCYQAVAAVFIAQALGLDLTLGEQLSILLTSTLASIGAAAVPGAGTVMLVIVLGTIDINAAGIALIMAPDRILDMCRTAVNVTGDATVACSVAALEGQLDGPPNTQA